MARVSVEDCQEKIPNRFELVMVAAKRAREIMEGAEPTITSKNKICVTALREIAEGTVLKRGEPMEVSGEVCNVDAFD